MQISRYIVALVCTVVWPPAKPNTDAPPQATLQNNTLPGHLTTHEITRTTRRTVKRSKYVETLSYECVDKLVQCNIALPQPGKILVYQMLAEQPAKVLRVFHDKDQIKPTPPPTQFNLSKGATKLVSEKKTARDCPTPTPQGDPAQAALLAGLMDINYWPAKKVEALHKWQRTFETALFEGTQTFQFIDLAEVDGQTAARIGLKLEGKFKGPLEREYVFGKAEGLIHWSRMDRTLLRLEGLAEYRRTRGGNPEEYDLKLEVSLRSQKQLGEPEQERVKEQMIAFHSALEARQASRPKDVLAACADFRKEWPGSIWLPAVAELEQQLSQSSGGTERMNMAQLKEVIVRGIVTYEAARTSHDFDLLESTSNIMAGIARDYGATLGKLCRDKDEKVRGNAAFALAFGQNPQDLLVVQKCLKDSSPKVKGLALTGLAAAGNIRINARLLLDSLEDSEPGVRRRSLQAIAACVQRENVLVATLVEKIDRLMVYDKHDGVRSDAVAALVALGAPADVPRLEEALKHELNTGIREQIHNGIEVLRSRS